MAVKSFLVANLTFADKARTYSGGAPYMCTKTPSITTLSTMTFSIRCLFVTLSISDSQHKCITIPAQHNNTLPLCWVSLMLGVTFYLQLYWMSLWWVSLRWMSLWWVSLRWMSLWWLSLFYHYSECHSAECRYAECRSAPYNTPLDRQALVLAANILLAVWNSTWKNTLAYAGAAWVTQKDEITMLTAEPNAINFFTFVIYNFFVIS